MKELFTKTEFDNAKSRGNLPLLCLHCNNTFYLKKSQIQAFMAGKTTKRIDFCSNSCARSFLSLTKTLSCEQCCVAFKKRNSQIKKTKHHFCSKSCAAKYSNSHKTKGTRVSKMEVYIQNQLILLFPNIKFDFNKTDAINAELDILIPSLNLAFELNGIFHYEPIYGSDKLSSMKTNDKRKIQACLEKGIELCIIDVSSVSYFKPIKAKKFLEIIVNLIYSKLSQ